MTEDYFQGPPEPWCYKEYLRAQAKSPVPVKYTLPGPMTLMDGSFNKCVDNDDNRNGDDFYDGANSHILTLWEFVLMK